MKKIFNYTSAVINYHIEGEGFPIVLLHGFGEDAAIWDEQVAFLKDHYKLIIPDLPGSGLSTLRYQQYSIIEKYSTVEYYADCIHTLLHYENIEACIIMGHSMGGYITLAFAEKYATLLKGFGLIHSSSFADNDEKKQTRLKGITMIEDYGSYAFLKNTTPNLFAAPFKTKHPDKIAALIEKGKSFSTKALQQYYAAMMKRPDRTEVLRKTEVPVLFILGTEDIAAPMQDVLKQTHVPKISYVHILENTGHMGMLESSYKMNSAILAFITDITMIWPENDLHYAG